MKIGNSDEAAFPRPASECDSMGGALIEHATVGLTKREWLAGQALAGLASETGETKFMPNLWEPNDEDGDHINSIAINSLAAAAVQIADAVIAELGKLKGSS